MFRPFLLFLKSEEEEEEEEDDDDDNNNNMARMGHWGVITVNNRVLSVHFQHPKSHMDWHSPRHVL
jgi:hypothetical protein